MKKKALLVNYSPTHSKSVVNNKKIPSWIYIHPQFSHNHETRHCEL